MSASKVELIKDGKRARLKAANRQAILDAARRVFARLGYDATNVRDIIRETQLAAGTFYNYFKSKEEVFQSLANSSAIRFRPHLQSVRDASGDFETFIRGAYRAYFQFLEDENRDAMSMGAPHMALIGVRADTPEMQAIFEEIRSDIEAKLAGSDGIELDSEYLTAAAIGIARDLGDHMLRRTPVDVDAATEFASELFLKGIQGILTIKKHEQELEG